MDDTVTHDSGPAAQPAELLPLPTVDESFYAIEGEHARGGIGRISCALDRRMGRRVAVKELLRRTPEAEARFVREALVTAKLQHPGVAPIYEAGRWPSGAPFYAMKLLSGRSLAEHIKHAATLAARLALLPNIIAVAETVAYAHAQGILHRDLKPANVMVGEFGETVVVDWGLAEERDAARTPGHVVGTPQYMAPEQARGQAIDERADVYSLGAMLYQALAGQAPYSATSSQEILDAIVAGPPQRLAARRPETPPELSAIVDKAMAREPSERYGGARELAADLRRFQTGQLVSSHRYSLAEIWLRWLRRYRLPVAIAAAALVALAALGAVSFRRVVAERNRAERQRAAAEEVMQFMLSDLRKQLEPIGRLELLEGVGAQVDQYYRALDSIHGSADAASTRRRAEARAVIGSVEHARGHVKEAVAAWQSSQQIFSTLPATDELVVEAAEVAAIRSNGEVELGQLDSAAETVRAAIERVQAAQKEHSVDASLALAQANLLYARQRIETDKHTLAAALATSKEALAIVVGLGDAPGALALRLKVLARVAALQTVEGDHAAGRAQAAECTRLADEARAREPGAAGWDNAAVYCRSAQANHLETNGDFVGALKILREGQAIREKLVARDPANVAWLESLADTMAYVADVEVRLDRLDAAQADATTARDIVEKLVARDAKNQKWQRNLLNIFFSLGEIASHRKDYDGAQRTCRTALARATELVERSQDKLYWMSDQAVFHHCIAVNLVDQGHPADGIVELRAALAIEERVAAANPTNSDASYRLGDTHLAIGDAELAQHHAEAALAEYRAGVKIFEALVAAQSDDAMAAAELGRGLFDIGEALSEQHADGRPMWRRAVEVFAPLDKLSALQPAYQRVFQRAQKRLAK